MSEGQEGVLCGKPLEGFEKISAETPLAAVLTTDGGGGWGARTEVGSPAKQ